MTFDIGATLAALVAAALSVVGYLLAKKDSAQETQISDLYTKHESDAKRLQELELHVASNHYPKTEINQILEQMKKHFDERFDRLEQFMAHRRSSDQL